MICSLAFIASTLWCAYSKQLNHNIAYNGPFNVNNVLMKKEHRRLAINAYQDEDVQFYHGVASGDPTDHDILIWTRVTPPFQNEYAMDINITNTTQLNAMKSQYESISVQWGISTSAESIDFDCSYSMCGVTETSIDIDYTIKIIIDNLTPNTWYYYQFKSGNTLSDIGRTKTIPSADTDIDSWSFAVGSCKQYAHGFFNNLGDIAQRQDLDMMVWLGDYIYEFPNTDLVNGTGIDREPFPNNYLYTLSHYRGRYLSHHLDANAQSAHAQLPWVIVWDDHEVVNNYWYDGTSSGSQDDTLYGVDFDERKLNGYQAFFEWTPTRTVDVESNGGLHRVLRIGNLFDLLMLDARSQRTEPAENTTFGADLSPDMHYAFGEKQRNWIINTLDDSQREGMTWRILGSDDVFGQSAPTSVFDGDEFFGTDKLEGYDAERQIIFDAIIDGNITNIISFAGGPHTGIAQKVYSTGNPIQDDSDSYPIFTEFVLDAISAPKLFEEYTILPYVDAYRATWNWVSPYFRGGVDGYCVMQLNKKRAKVEYWINNNTRSATTKSVLDITLCVYDGSIEFEQCDTDNPTTEPSVSPTLEIPDDIQHDDGKRDVVMSLTITWSIVAFVCCVVVIWVFIKRNKQKDGSDFVKTGVYDPETELAKTDDKQTYIEPDDDVQERDELDTLK